MFLTSIFRAYSRLAVFAVGILLGIQVPSFVEQYNQRIDAHFREVNINISGFQDTADRLFDGDLEALIAYYANSNDAVFESDAGSIRLVVTRYNRLLVERSALDSNAFAVAMHVMFNADQEFYQEAMRQYSYTVPLNTIAIQWGLAVAIFITLILDLTIFIFRKYYGLAKLRKSNVAHN